MIQKLKAKANSKQGFTLAELLVVVAIIAILVAIAIPTFTGAMDKAHQAVDDANIRAAFAEYQVGRLTEDGTAEIKSADEAKTYVEGKYGDLQYYSNVVITDNNWKGGTKATS